MVAVNAESRTSASLFVRRPRLPRASSVIGDMSTLCSNMQLALFCLQRTFTRNLLGVASGMVLAISPASGQTGSQIQYTYDAAGNLVQVTRVPTTLQPDLAVSNLNVGVIGLNADNSYSIPVTFLVSNLGTVSANPTWYDRGYLSANSVLHDNDQALGGFNTRTTSLGVGGSYSVSKTFTTSTTTPAGNYTLIVKTDGGAGTGLFSPTGANIVGESNEANNTQTASITLPANPRPDLAISNVLVGTISASQAGAYIIPVTYTVTNVGAVNAPAFWHDVAYLSADATLDNADQNLTGYHQHSTALAVGASYTITMTFTTTAATTPGTYTLFVKADGSGAATVGGTNTDNGRLAEANDVNNIQALTLVLPAKPDLAISNVSVGTISASQAGAYNIPVTYTVTNVGGVSAPAFWYDVAYLATDATLDNADQNLTGYHQHSTALASGASYTITMTFTTTAATTPGTYTLFVKADGSGAATVGGTNTDNGRLAEGNAANNIQALTLILPAKPDLAISNVSVGAISAGQAGAYNIPVTYTVTNVGGVSAPAFWYDVAYLSADATLDNADQNLTGYHQHSTGLAVGASYTITMTFTTIAATPPGTYTLFVKADGSGAATVGGTNTDNGRLAEGNEANNVAAINATLP